ARRLAECLAPRADLDVTLSLAGRTAKPAGHPVPVRIGGFGGASGLAAFISAQEIDVVIDATHPYAARISANAAAAAERMGVPLLVIERPAWEPVGGDRWIEVADMPAGVAALEGTPRRVFLALGRNELRSFEAVPQHFYLIRSVDPVEPPLALPQAEYLTGRGPFEESAEHALLARHRIDVVVAKNSGGAATYGKIAAARRLGLTVIMLRRPPPRAGAAGGVEEVLAQLDHMLACAMARGV
ncbi:MAG: cobalt-precorrin-6A reductase, partial [Xanthobacteraceae bacterium]|nr:cobalt-precorrin-6A reductase [Xanthobacteraceae bacterium]